MIINSIRLMILQLTFVFILLQATHNFVMQWFSSLGCFVCYMVGLRKAIYQSKVIDLFSPLKTFGIWIIISFFTFKYFFTRTFNDIYFVTTFILTTIRPFCAIVDSKRGGAEHFARSSSLFAPICFHAG